MISLILGASIATASVAAEPMTLDDAIRVATENAFSLKIAGANVEKVRQKINEVKGMAGPKLTADGTYTRFDRATVADFGPTPVIITPVEAKSAKFTLSFPIDIMGNIGRGVKAASLTLSASKDTYQAQLNDLKLSVRQSFFRVLQAQEMVKVSANAVLGAKERLDNTKKMLAAGVVAKVDVLRFETLLAQAESELIAGQNGLELAKSAFNNALGRSIDADVNLAPVAEIPSQDRPADDLARVAVGLRPELKALASQIRALGYVREAEERGLQPSLAVAAVHTQNFDGGLGSRKESTTGVLSLSVPLFDSGITRARVKQARQDELIAKTQEDQVKLGVSLEVRQALTNLANARARLEVAKRQVDFATESYRLAKVRHAAGEGIVLEVIDAQTEDTRARAGLVAATYDCLTAYAQLQRAIGRDDIATAQIEEKKEGRR